MEDLIDTSEDVRAALDRVLFFSKWMKAIAKSARELFNAGHNPVKILQIAAGGHRETSAIVRDLVDYEIKYQMIVSDISPKLFNRGYRILQEKMPEEELKNVVYVLADAENLRRDIRKVLFRDGSVEKDLKIVLINPNYACLNTGYKNNRRIVNFKNESIDMILGVGAYTNINTKTFMPAIRESYRVLSKGGYHIIFDSQIEKINPEQERTPSALLRAKKRNLEILIRDINKVFGRKPEEVLSEFRYYSNANESEDQAAQFGDYLKDSVIIHKKK